MRVHELKDLKLVYQLTGTAGKKATITFTVKTKSTSTDITNTTLLVVPATPMAGRQVAILPLDNYEGEVVRLKIAPEADCVFKLLERPKLRLRPIGEYYDGSFGEYFDTKEIALA
jgi:hypothetical protein